MALGVGVVGIGFGQRVHVPAWQAEPRCRVVALAASTAARAQTVAERLGVAAASDWRALVTARAVDIVSIAVPPSLQPEIAMAAARAGKAILCEKPLALDVAAAERMLAEAEAAGIVHGVDFTFAAIPAWQAARALVVEGRLGRLRHALVSWRVETRAQQLGSGWKTERAMGGGALLGFVSHTLFAVEWLLGRPIERVMARLGGGSGDAEARVSAWLQLSDGVDVEVSVATDAPHGSGHRIELHGDAGALTLHNPTRDYARGFELRWGTRDQPFAPMPVPALPHDGAFADGRAAALHALVARFVDAVERRAPDATRPDLRDGVRVQRLLAAATQAHQTGTWQTTT